MADQPSSSDAAPAAEPSNPHPSSALSSETEKKPSEQPAAAQPTAAAAAVPAVEFKPPPQMQRPGLGKSGKRIDLLCNHFSVKYTGTEDVFHYDVSISDAGSASGPNDGIANKNLCRTILAKVHQVYGMKEFGGKRLAYDGEKSLFTAGPLQFQTQEFSVLLEESTNTKAGPSASQEDPKKKRKVAARSREFKVKIEYAATVKMGAIGALLSGKRNARAQDALRVLDIVMRQHAAAKGYLLIKDNYFSPTFGVADIGEGVQTCQGFHVSFRPSLQGLSLNLDTATTTVIKPSSVLEFIRERFNPSNPRSIDWDKVRRVLKGIKVETPHTQMVHRIIGFSDSSCAEQKFMKKKLDDTGNMVEIELTIQKYYEMQYNITVRYPDLPCIAAGRPKRPTYIPVELCNIVEGQRYTKALSSSQRQKMIDQARQGPDQRKNVVQKAMEVSDYNSNDLVRDFNIKIDSKMRVVPGRLLDAPALKFGNTEEVPRGGRWNFNSKVMASAVQIKSWVVLNFDGRIPTQVVERIAQDLARVCSTKGMNIPAHDFTLQEPRHNQQLPAAQRVHNMIQEVKQRLQSPPAFMLCILPVRKTSDLYGPLKTLLQTKHAIITQCIAPPKQVKDQYLTNVALKINAKVGGYNSFLSLEFQGRLPKVSHVPTVIFGLDVSHGPPGYSDSPSIAAVVASREWPHVSKYGVRLRAQSRKMEMISGLFEDSKSGGMIVELLKDFHNSCQQVPRITDRRPKQVIIFRDGVSESQFEQVLRDEYLAFKKAFDYIDKSGNYDPKITLIVVQKRHHTRFFPANGSGNVAPGTIVDANLCHPTDYDFYLCAHAGLIGTTRPTHYHVLVDENNFTVDELQQLTHSLCYTYARSTTAVSTVTPVAYAHLAATHARNFLDSEGGSETSSMTGRSERSTPVHLPDLHAQMKTKMFFC